MLLRYAIRLLVPRLAPLWVGLAVGLAEASAVIDWDATRALVLDLPPAERAAAVVLVAATGALSSQAALAAVLLGPELAFARRSAQTDAQMARLAAALAAAALAPWALLCARVTDPALGLGVLLGAAPAALARVGRSTAAWTAAGLTGALVAALLRDHLPALAWAPAAMALGLPWLWADRRDPPPSLPLRSLRWPGRAWAAWVARDLVGAWRCSPGLGRDLALGTGVIAVCSVALRVNGDPAPAFAGPAASLASLTGLAGASAVLVGALQAVGGRADEPAAPISPAGRAALHAVVAAAGWAPVGVAVALLGPGAAADRWARTLSVGLAVATITPAAALSGDRLKREYTGPLLWAAIAVGVLSLASTPVAAATTALLAAGAQHKTTRGLIAAREAR